MANEAIPKRGILENIGGAVGGAIDFITKPNPMQQAMIEGKQASAQQQVLANTMQQLQLVLQNAQSPEQGNAMARELLIGSGIISPEQAGQLDFSRTIQRAPTIEQAQAIPLGTGEQLVTETQRGKLTRTGAQPKPAPAADVQDIQVGDQVVKATITRDDQGNITGFTPLTVGDEPAVVPPERQEIRTGALTTGAATEAQKDILSLSGRRNQLKGLKETVEQDPGLLTFPRRAQAAVTGLVQFLGGKTDTQVEKTLEKVKLTDPQAAQKLATFQADVENAFLPFRKFITGVAGGMKEFGQIAKAFPQTGDPLSKFMGKADSAINATVTLSSVLEAAITDGIIAASEIETENPTDEQRNDFQQRFRAGVLNKITSAGLTLGDIAEIREGEGVDQLIQRSQLIKFQSQLKDNEILMQDAQGNVSAFTQQELNQGLGQGFTPVTGF